MSDAKDFKKPSNEILKSILTREQYTCTQEEGTEAPFKNAYWDNHDDGLYVDVVSHGPLFSSLDKFDSGSGWPSFTKPIVEQAVYMKTDYKIGLARTEIRSKKADSHLGHVFDDGPGADHKRYCINSAALVFIPLKDLAEKGLGKYLFGFATKKHWEVALIAGGCFWGMQDLFRHQKGVIYTDVGYTGGNIKNATYEDVHTGKSGHAEAIRVLFDTTQTSYKEILFYFFKIHDPTTLNRQGNDIGSQYRSAIFYSNKTQHKIAEEVIRRVEHSKKWNGPIVTKLEKAADFYIGEEDHQNYLAKHPGGYTCHFPRNIEF